MKEHDTEPHKDILAVLNQQLPLEEKRVSARQAVTQRRPVSSWIDQWDGLKGQDLPIEARIVAAADVIDALTSKRPHKEAWSIDDDFDLTAVQEQLDKDYVQTQINNRERVEEVQARFFEIPFG